jgi:hypothetical protein
MAHKNDGLRMTVADDRSLHFKVRNGITVRVAYVSQTQLSVEFWREDPPAIVPPDAGNIFVEGFRKKIAKVATKRFNEGLQEDSVPHLYDDLGKIATALGSQVGSKKAVRPSSIGWLSWWRRPANSSLPQMAWHM